MKKIFFGVLLLLLLIGSASALTGFNYTTPYNLTGNSGWSGDQTNYPITFTLNNTTGSNTATTVYLNGHSLQWGNTSTWADIRVTDSANNTLPIWFENTSATSTSVPVWVNVSTVSKTVNTTLYIWYGNSLVSTADNGPSVFPLFDHFNYPSGYYTLYPFNKYTGNPLFNSNSVEPRVLRNGSTNWWLYYGDNSGNIKLNTSITQTGFSAGSTVLSGSNYCNVVYNGTMYRMVYAAPSYPYQTINLSTSSDGTTWTNQGVLITYGTAGIDPTQVADPFEIQVGSTYYLFYSGWDGTIDKVCYATSPNGTPGSYTKQGVALSLGTAGTWDSTTMGDPYVVQYDTGKYMLWYSGWDGSNQKVGYATSTDMVNWTKSADNPLLWSTQAWETSNKLREPSVIIESGVYNIWFSDDANRIGYLIMPQNLTTKLPIKVTSPFSVSGQTWNIANSILTITGRSNANDYFRSVNQFGTNYAIRLYGGFVTKASGGDYFGFSDYAATAKGVFSFATDGYRFATYNTAYSHDGQNAPTSNNVVDIIRNGSTSAIFFQNGGGAAYTATTNLPTVNLYAGFREADSASYSQTFDWFLVRPYVNPEPTGLGGAEQNYTPIVPVANFNANQTTGAEPLDVGFTDTSTNTPTSWYWEFGDSNTSTDQNTVHRYYLGNWSVNFSATNSAGTDWKNGTWINVTSGVTVPVASFTENVSIGYPAFNVQFNDTSSNTPTSWNWSFGDGQYSTDQNATHTYQAWIGNSSASYNVSLNATNSAGSNVSANQTKIAYPLTSTFTSNLTSGKPPLTVQFNTTYGNGTATTWAWDFGDTGTSTDRNATHTYSSAGTYTVTLNASNAYSYNWSQNASMITVNPLTPPVASFTTNTTSGKIPLSVQFTDTSTNTPTGWLWQWGDGTANTTGTGMPIHTFTVPGTYQVNLTASNVDGSNLSANTAITAQPLTPPVANFTSNTTSGTLPKTIQFWDNSTNTPTSWQWSWGDLTPNGTTQNPTHNYTTAGTYTVILTATNADGSGSLQRTDYITIASGVIPFPGESNTPTNPLGGILYWDVNGNGRIDYNDLVIFFNYLAWAQENEPTWAFDFNSNGRLDYNDVQLLFGRL